MSYSAANELSFTRGFTLQLLLYRYSSYTDRLSKPPATKLAATLEHVRVIDMTTTYAMSFAMSDILRVLACLHFTFGLHESSQSFGHQKMRKYSRIVTGRISDCRNL